MPKFADMGHVGTYRDSEQPINPPFRSKLWR
jgi:hypothetical protein